MKSRPDRGNPDEQLADVQREDQRAWHGRLHRVPITVSCAPTRFIALHEFVVRTVPVVRSFDENFLRPTRA
jgi:hypothetical protein